MSEVYKLTPAGSHYIPEVGKNCFWEIIIAPARVWFIHRGGPLETVALRITGKFEYQEFNVVLPKLDSYVIEVDDTKIRASSAQDKEFVFDIEGSDIQVEDWWGWGNG